MNQHIYLKRSSPARDSFPGASLTTGTQSLPEEVQGSYNTDTDFVPDVWTASLVCTSQKHPQLEQAHIVLSKVVSPSFPSGWEERSPNTKLNTVMRSDHTENKPKDSGNGTNLLNLIVILLFLYPGILSKTTEKESQ